MSEKPRRLLPREAFAAVFEPFRGRRIGYVRPFGNAGDLLIEQAALQLFDEFGIAWCRFDPDAASLPTVDELVFGGGGNMGTRYRNNWELRGRLFRWGLPVSVLPQTFSSPEDRPYRRVFVRERASLVFCPAGILAPDLSLGLCHAGPVPPPTRGAGVFLRRDPERAGGWTWFKRDPARLCGTPQEYLELATRYERIITDRLHFAICGLLLGRETTLLPNDNHKNESMHETWLRDLGCRFARSASEALRGLPVRRRFWRLGRAKPGAA